MRLRRTPRMHISLNCPMPRNTAAESDGKDEASYSEAMRRPPQPSSLAGAAVSGKNRRGRPASKVCLQDLVSFFDWPNVKVSQVMLGFSTFLLFLSFF